MADDRVERVAKALSQARWRTLGMKLTWDEEDQITEHEREGWQGEAREFLAALDAANTGGE